VYTTLLTFMPGIFRSIFDIHDFIEFNEQIVMKNELFSKFLPTDFLDNFFNNGTKALLSETATLKASLKKLKRENEKLKLQAKTDANSLEVMSQLKFDISGLTSRLNSEIEQKLRLEQEAERFRGQVAILNRTNQSKESSIQELKNLILELKQTLKTEEDLNAENLVKITELESQQKAHEEEINLKLALEKISPQKSVDSDLSSDIDTVTARVKQLSDEINLEVDSLKSEYTKPAPVYSETER
jgi:chromosome segregation ATPase